MKTLVLMTSPVTLRAPKKATAGGGQESFRPR